LAGGELDPTGSSVNCISAVAQGDGESERDGRVYYIESIDIYGTCSIPETEGATSPESDDRNVRIAVIWDTQTNNAQLNAEDVFLTTATIGDYHSFRNLQFSKRFKVLKNKRVRIPAAQAQVNEGGANLFANAQVVVPFEIHKTFETPIKVRCSLTTGVVAAITDNSLHICAVTTKQVTNVGYNARIRFTG